MLNQVQQAAVPTQSVIGRSSYAPLGMIAVASGTLVAILSVPAETVEPASLRLPAIFLTAGILTVPVARAFGSGLRTLLRAEHVICIGMLYWVLLDLILAAYPFHGVSRQALVDGLGAVGLTVFGLWAGMLMRPWRPPQVAMRATHVPNLERKLFSLILVFFALGVVNFLHRSDYSPAIMLQSIGASRWDAPWTRGQLGDWDAFLEHLSYFGYTLPTLAVVLAVKRGWSNPAVWLSAILALLITALLAQGGGRRIVGVVIGAALVAWILLQQRIGPRKILIIAAAAASLLVFMQVMLIYRGVGLGGLLTAGEGAQISAFDKFRVDDNFLRLSQIIEIVPDEHPFVYEQQLIYILVRPVPRAFWPGKPVDPGFDLPTVIGMQGVSLSSSMIGEWYLCFGWVAVFFGGYFLGRMAAMWNLVLESSHGNAKSILYAFGLMALFAGLRSLQDLVLMSYVVLVWIVGTKLITKRDTSGFAHANNRN